MFQFYGLGVHIVALLRRPLHEHSKPSAINDVLGAFAPAERANYFRDSAVPAVHWREAASQ